MAPGKREGYALKSGEGPSIEFRGTKMTVKLSGAASEESYSLIEMVHPSGVGPALHIHPTGAEAFYVLEGHYTIHCGEQQYEAAAGDFVYVPKGLPHAYQSGANGGKVLVLSPDHGGSDRVCDVTVSVFPPSLFYSPDHRKARDSRGLRPISKTYRSRCGAVRERYPGSRRCHGNRAPTWPSGWP